MLKPSKLISILCNFKRQLLLNKQGSDIYVMVCE